MLDKNPTLLPYCLCVGPLDAFVSLEMEKEIL